MGNNALLHVLSSSVAEHLRGTWRFCDAPRLCHHERSRSSRVRSVLKECLQAAWEHLLETNDEHAVGCAVCNHVAAHVQAGASCAAVVVDIVHGDACHAELVEDSLSASRIAIAVTCNALVDVVVVDVRVKHGLDTRLKAQLWVVNLATRLDELGHAHAEDVDGLLLRNHGVRRIVTFLATA